MPLRTASLGFPRIGANRELKHALEAYWNRKLSREGLLQVGRELRLRHWKLQQSAGIDLIPCNDFSWYDHVLDMACLLGCVPSRFGWNDETVALDLYFAMARSTPAAEALELTKWFDTNYHYLVPEFERGRPFRIGSTKVFDEYTEARAAGIPAVPVLIGPVTFTLLGKATYEGFSISETVDRLLPVYAEILRRLQAMGASVQMDEPCLVTDLSAEAAQCLRRAYEHFARAIPQLEIRLATYFGGLHDNLELAFDLPVSTLHVDLVRAPAQLDACLERAATTGRGLSLGLLDGRNVWRNDLGASLAVLDRAVTRLGGDRITVAPSCSLLHVPLDLDQEMQLDDELRGWMAFARQKLGELTLLGRAVSEGRSSVAAEIEASDAIRRGRRASSRVHDSHVRRRMASVTEAMLARNSPYEVRRKCQSAALDLPLFPTTTIGSFPQTAEIRRLRADHRAGRLNESEYESAMRLEIERAVRLQERVGLDVLVHGEPERSDMVEYFAAQLQGYVISQQGWVQAYGNRVVKPPILYGDVSRVRPMTLEWAEYAQSLTARPMKGMLTGPVTMLQWSFVRDDQPRAQTCRQVALAMRDEVLDLERAGIRIIQIDEPALREGLPLHRSEWPDALRWAVECFRLASSGVRDETQIHSHMCYSEFNDIIESVAAMDADVVSIEASRSRMELLEAFVAFRYPNAIGPGIYEVHTSRVPSVDEFFALLSRAREVLAAGQIWVNPDCGLKTRAWAEIEPALSNLVAAARRARKRLA